MTPELRQKLLELHYDLLPDGEAVELRRRMESEPELAGAYAEAQKTAALFRPGSSFDRKQSRLQATGDDSHEYPRNIGRAEAFQTFGHPPFLRPPANWFVGLAAALLVMVTAGGYFFHRHQVAAIAAEHLRLIVSGPSTLENGVEAKFAVRTTEITGDPASAQVEVGLYSPDNKLLFGNNKATDSHGNLDFVVPASMALPANATIKFAVWNPANKEEPEEFSAPLVVKPVR